MRKVNFTIIIYSISKKNMRNIWDKDNHGGLFETNLKKCKIIGGKWPRNCGESFSEVSGGIWVTSLVVFAFYLFNFLKLRSCGRITVGFSSRQGCQILNLSAPATTLFWLYLDRSSPILRFSSLLHVRFTVGSRQFGRMCTARVMWDGNFNMHFFEENIWNLNKLIDVTNCNKFYKTLNLFFFTI